MKNALFSVFKDSNIFHEAFSSHSWRSIESKMGEPTERLFSAPGKLLLAGGYLVLFPEFQSFVVALSSRMHAVVNSKPSNATVIQIDSPQFEGAWEYRFEQDRLVEINGKRNPFIESTLNIVCNYYRSNLSKEIQITIYSDPGYHSQDNTNSKTNGAKTFLFHGKDITEVPKTGLGSSAGLVTVITTALMSQLAPSFQLSSKDRNLVHNLAQIAHCTAQKKIGSGFDVGSATFGSIVYRRFRPSVIDELISGNLQNLKQIADLEWQFSHEPCKLPPGIKLLVGDVSGGSNTPKLVSKVLEWKLKNPDQASQLFEQLDLANTRLISSINNLNNIAKNDPVHYRQLLDLLSVSTSTELAKSNENVALLLDVVEAIADIRTQLRSLTSLTTAEIEPLSQTKLLDHCSSHFKGCIGGVVPGAGGYDAICLLCHEDAVPQIMNTPMKNVTWLDLHEEASGVQEQNPEDYNGIV